MRVSIICPIYNGEKYLEGLHKNLLRQKKFDIEQLEIIYVLTESKDKSKLILDKLGTRYYEITPDEFSHSKTREMMVNKATGDIVVFISQDVIMKDEVWLYNLVNPIIAGECEASFSRQLCTNNTIEKYIRLNNYPDQSRIVSQDDVTKLGLMTFFYSDASSAIKRELYLNLNGYDNKDLIINEDMYIAYKIINSGNRIKYCADSQVYHSHIFTLTQLFNRYFDTGVFLKENSHFLEYGSNGSGISLAKGVFKNALSERNYRVILNILPNFGARFIGSNLGKRYDKLSKDKVIKFSLNKRYWTKKNRGV